MDALSLILIAVSLSMDAFAIAVLNGIAIRNACLRHAVAMGLVFGGFQLAMPIAGYYLGFSFSALVNSASHWIAFGLLAIIGGKMLFEAFRGDKANKSDTGISPLMPGKLITLGFATSIDAFAVGISFALTAWNIWIAAPVIGMITFAISFAGVLLGKKLGLRFKRSTAKLGGIVLIVMGIKILAEHFAV
jgi:putative Mn2+ efflux pump MntP